MARIGVDARPLSVSLSGIGRYTFEILQRLADSQHTFYLYSDKPIPAKHMPSASCVCREGTVTGAALSTLFAQVYFPIWARRDRLDLFWSPRHHLPLMMAGVPSVLTVHDLVWKKVPETMRKGGRFIEALLMPLSLRKSSKIISVSEATRRDLQEQFQIELDKVSVIYEASCLSGSHKGVAQPPYILFVGTLEPRKNLLTLLKAFAQFVKRHHTHHRLVLAGQPGWMRESLDNILNELGVCDKVEVSGYVDDQRLEQLYGQASVLAMPSLYEGFGLPLVEAMAFSVPLITANISSMPEIAGDAAVLVDALNEGSVLQALERVLLNEDEWQRLSAESSKRSEFFSWNKAAVETMQVLNEVLSNA